MPMIFCPSFAPKNIASSSENSTCARLSQRFMEGGAVIQETRLWNPETNRTTSMRGKEEAHDYRYFPDPDLLPLVVDEDWIERVKGSLPELPDEKRARFQERYGLSAYDAGVLTAARDLADYFEACAAGGGDAKQAANWVMGPVMGLLNARGESIAQSPVSARDLAGLLILLEKGVISGKIAKTVFEEMANTGKPAKEIVEKKGLVQVTDTSAIEEIVLKVLADNSQQVTEYQNGKTQVLGFFVGRVMKETRGTANPKLVNEVLKKNLGG